MKKLNFIDMQIFIQTVVDGVMENGAGYKEFYIQFCKAKFYNNYEFKSNDISKIYDELENIGMDNEVSIDQKQYQQIMTAIDEEIHNQLLMKCATMVMSGTDKELSSLIKIITEKVENLPNLKELDSEKISDLINITTQLKKNASAKNIVKAVNSLKK